MQLGKERCVTVSGGDGDGGLAQVGIDGGGIKQIFLRSQAGLDDDGRIVAVEAEEIEQLGAQFAGIVGVGWGGISEADELRLKCGADPR